MVNVNTHHMTICVILYCTMYFFCVMVYLFVLIILTFLKCLYLYSIFYLFVCCPASTSDWDAWFPTSPHPCMPSGLVYPLGYGAGGIGGGSLVRHLWVILGIMGVFAPIFPFLPLHPLGVLSLENLVSGCLDAQGLRLYAPSCHQCFWGL